MPKRQPKPKAVSYELIARDSVIGHPMYCLLDELVDAHHEDLKHARVALAWCTSWKPDVDGNVTLGRCMKASDLHRELAPYDFVVLLARWFWRAEETTPEQRRWLLDHELCHAAVKHDKHGEPAEDERGRRIWRTRRHDYEEFVEIIERHGLEVSQRAQQVAAAIRRAPAKFKGCEKCQDSPEGAGWEAVVEGDVRRVRRCACYVEFTQMRAELAAATA